MRFDEIRPQRDRPVIARQRFTVTLERIQRDAAIDQRLDTIGPHAERPIVALERIAEALHLLEGIAAIVERENMTRGDLERGADLPHGGGRIATLHEDDAEQMQAVEMFRLARQNALIDSLGFRQLPGLMQRQSFCEQAFGKDRCDVGHFPSPPAGAGLLRSLYATCVL